MVKPELHRSHFHSMFIRSRDIESGLHSMGQSSSTNTDPSPAITDLLSFDDVSRDATPATPDYLIKSLSMEPAPSLPKPAHAEAHTRLDHIPASSFCDAQSIHQDVPASRPIEALVPPSSPNVQRDVNQSCAPQAGPSKKRTAAPYEQDNEGYGPAALKRIRHTSVVPNDPTTTNVVAGTASPWICPVPYAQLGESSHAIQHSYVIA